MPTHNPNMIQEGPQQPIMTLHFSETVFRNPESRKQHSFPIPDYFTADCVLRTSLSPVQPIQLYISSIQITYILIYTRNVAATVPFNRTARRACAATSPPAECCVWRYYRR